MSERSMSILQQADEERARRKDNPEGWPEVKVRLEARASTGQWMTDPDLYAALRRVEEATTIAAQEHDRAEKAEAELSMQVHEAQVKYDRLWDEAAALKAEVERQRRMVISSTEAGARVIEKLKAEIERLRDALSAARDFIRDESIHPRGRDVNHADCHGCNVVEECDAALRGGGK